MNQTTSGANPASKTRNRALPADHPRLYRRLRYPLPPRTSLTEDGTWDRRAILMSLQAGGWFASPTTRYRFVDAATATYAAEAQAFFDDLLYHQTRLQR